MARVMRYTHGRHEKTGDVKRFAPGDEVPPEYVKSLTNPKVWEGDAPEAPAEEPADDSDANAPDGPDYEGFNNDELRAMLEARGLDARGNKPELVQRLRDADDG